MDRISYVEPEHMQVNHQEETSKSTREGIEPEKQSNLQESCTYIYIYIYTHLSKGRKEFPPPAYDQILSKRIEGRKEERTKSRRDDPRRAEEGIQNEILPMGRRGGKMGASQTREGEREREREREREARLPKAERAWTSRSDMYVMQRRMKQQQQENRPRKSQRRRAPGNREGLKRECE
jgi:hypothetical protein